MNEHPLDDVLTNAGAHWCEDADHRVARHFGDPQSEYAAALHGVVIHDARQRGLVEITGKDRANWLNNLVTNAIRDLRPGEGNYTFATNVQGRILLDFNMLVLHEAIWLDIDRRLVAKALKHFDRYTITEDVRCTDRSHEWVRIALLGPKAAEIADALGATHAPVMASLGSTMVPLVGHKRLMVRNDHLAGVFGVELYVAAADAAACWSRLLEIGRPVGIQPAGRDAVLSLRVEAGIPQYGREIDEQVLPLETGQIKRAVNHAKGCYLGQEVIERMRSHQTAPPRTLVGLRLSGDPGPQSGPLPLLKEDRPAGRLMTACYSFHAQAFAALAYVRTPLAQIGAQLTLEGRPDVRVEITELPLRPFTGD